MLERSAVQDLLRPVKQLVALANGRCWQDAQASLRFVPARAQALAAQLGLADGKVLLQGSKSGPTGLQAGRYGPAMEQLIRADLAEVARYNSLATTARGLLGLIVAGLQDSAQELMGVLTPIPVPYHMRRLALEEQEKEEAAAKAAAKKAQEEEEEAAAAASSNGPQPDPPAKPAAQSAAPAASAPGSGSGSGSPEPGFSFPISPSASVTGVPPILAPAPPASQRPSSASSRSPKAARAPEPEPEPSGAASSVP